MESDQIEAYVPPNNREAEHAVLGSLLIDPDSINRVREVLNPHSFYVEVNKWIYEAALSLNDRSEPVDAVTMLDELRRHGRLEDVGGEAYIVGLINTVPTSINDVHYAGIVEETGERRRMIRSASHIVALAHDETQELKEVIDQAQEDVYELGKSLFTQATVHVREPTREVMDLVAERSETGTDLTGVPTGFTDIDWLLGGLQKTELTIIAGRPGMGKSAFQGSVAMLAGTRYEKHVGIFSLEMHATQWVMRMIAAMSNISSESLKRGELAEKDWPVFYDACGRLSEAKIFIDDTTGLTTSQLRAKARRLDSEWGLDLIIIDFLQMMQTAKDFRNRVHQVSYITQQLKALAKEIEVPILASSQLSRAVEQRADKRPQLSDLRDAGTIEEFADVVGFIYRDEYYNPDSSERPNIAEFNFAKNRNGKTGVVDLYWNGRLIRFNNLQRQQLQL